MKSFITLSALLVPLTVASAISQRTPAPVSFPYHFEGTLKILDEHGDGFAVVSNELNNAGVFGITINGDRLKVKLTAQSENEPFDILTTNGNASFPYFAPVNGWYNSGSDLEKGNPNHLHLCGTSKTKALDRPQSGMGSCTEEPENIESQVWYLNPRTGEVYPKWVNADGSIPEQTLIYYADGPWGKNALVIAGDLVAFEREYGAFQKVYLTVGSRTDFPDTPGKSSSFSGTVGSYLSLKTAVIFFGGTLGLVAGVWYWRRRRATKQAHKQYLPVDEEEMSLSHNDGNKFTVGHDD